MCNPFYNTGAQAHNKPVMPQGMLSNMAASLHLYQSIPSLKDLVTVGLEPRTLDGPCVVLWEPQISVLTIICLVETDNVKLDLQLVSFGALHEVSVVAAKAVGKSGARAMQEFKYFRDGATLVISLDGLNWLSERRCHDKGVKKRDDELQVLISSGQMIQAEEELQPITCFCILDQRGRGIPRLWRNCDRTSSLVTRLPYLSFPPRQRRLLVEPTLHSTLSPSACSVSECTKEAPWTWLILNMQDMFSFLKKDLNIVTQQDSVTENQRNRLIIFCDEDIPQQLFSDTLPTEDCWTSLGDTGRHVTDNVSHWSLAPDNINNNESEGIQHELVSKDNFNTCKRKSLLKSCQIYAAPGDLSEGDEAVKRRKSVSFDDDVMVYLFDQESPTVELHSGPCTPPPSSHSCNLPDVALEDGGLEWEDDFSALEKSCHFQCIKNSAPQHYTLSLPVQSCSALSRRRFLSQTCLFLTHVTESDLEL